TYAKAQLYKISLDKDSIARYREFEKRMYDETSALNSAKREGKEEGLKEGELKAKRNLAKSLLDVLDIETISKKTGLSIEEIK
ncbi:hypothetical protein LI062_17575, partial [Clostridium perfringens]|nr:hypothetical protein [Clostridium perfringens]